MCKDTFKRFETIFERVCKEDQINKLKYRVIELDTKLGTRKIRLEKSVIFNNIILTYYDKDNTILFRIEVCRKKGKIKTHCTKIDEPAMFAAIMEMEFLLGIRKKESILEKLLEVTNIKGVFNYYNFTMFGK